MKSSCKPSKAKNLNAEYFSFNSNKLIVSIKENAKRSLFVSFEGKRVDQLFKKDIKIKTFGDLELYIKEHGELPPNSYTSKQLGTYITNIGFDEEKQEKYISYYDIWDIDPPMLKDLNIDIDQFNFPFEIYGRIYKSDFDANAQK